MSTILPNRGQFLSKFFLHKIAQLANLSHVNSLLKMKYEVTNKNFSFYIQFFIIMCSHIQSEHYFRYITVFCSAPRYKGYSRLELYTATQ